MRHESEATERISNSFERFNPYAQKALEGDDDADVYAQLAIAFEVSQLRYQLSLKPVDNNGRKDQATRHERPKHGRPTR